MIPEPMTMNLLAIGQQGRVAELTAAGIQRRRMLDLALWKAPRWRRFTRARLGIRWRIWCGGR